MIKKLFNILTDEQEKVISEQYTEFSTYIYKLQKDINDKNEQIVIDKNTNCTKCKSKNIVDRYIEKYDKVNHCNECGNEWSKTSQYDRWSFYSYRSIDDVVKTNLDSYVENNYIPDELKHFYAESIYRFKQETKNTLSLRVLRKHFKSIHDDNRSVREKKIERIIEIPNKNILKNIKNWFYKND